MIWSKHTNMLRCFHLSLNSSTTIWTYILFNRWFISDTLPAYTSIFKTTDTWLPSIFWRQKRQAICHIWVVKLCMRSAKPFTATSALEGQGCYLGVCLELPQHCHWGGRALWPQWPGSSGTLHPRSQINPSVWCSWLWKWTAPPPPSDPTCTHHTHTR